MTDHVAPPEDDEEDDEGLPLFWGLLLVGAVTAIAVWLFGLFPDDTGAASTTTATTLAEEPVDISTATTEASAAAGTVIDVLSADGRFSVLLGLLDRTGLMTELADEGPFTVFAPTDEALSGVDLGDDDAVRAVLLRHVVSGRLGSGDVFGGTGTLETLGGDRVSVSADPEPSIGGAPVVSPDLEADNGIVHVVGAPVLSAGLQRVRLLADDGRFSTLLAAVDAAGLSDVISGDVTILAPTDDAFAGLPDGVVAQLLAEPERLGTLLGHHVVPGTLSGGGTYVTGSGDEVVVTDAEVNGVAIADRPATDVITLDGVLVPPGFVLADVNDILDLAPITFEVGSAIVTAEGQAELDRAVEYLTANPVVVEIGGHTDADGSDEANQTLSEERAQAIVDYLVAGGVDGSLLTAVGYGESLPIADNATDEGKAQNRRIEFSILG